jgi:two-component system LytT family sensor kinase
LGQKNIIERYALLCERKVKIENGKDYYAVSLPILKNITPHEDTDS